MAAIETSGFGSAAFGLDLADLSIFVLEAGVRILEREKPDLVYLTLSDYIQNKYAPGPKRRTISMSRLTATWGAWPRSG